VCRVNTAFQVNLQTLNIWAMALTTNSHLGPRLKKEWSYLSPPPLCFMACSRVNFTFIFMVLVEELYLYSPCGPSWTVTG